LDVSFSNLIYFEETYDLKKPETRTIDVSFCRVLYDKVDTTLDAIHAGDSIIVVSYKDEGRRIPEPRKGASIESQLAAFPSPIIADEIHIKPKGKPVKEEPVAKKKTEDEKKGMTWQEMLMLATKVTVAAISLILLIPLLFLLYLLIRSGLANNPKSKADQVYRAALYRFHMAGVERGMETPLEYARGKVNAAFKAGFEEFMHVYLRLKYGPGTLLSGDNEIINKFAAAYGPAITKYAGFFNAFVNYFNLLRAGRYFFRPEKVELQNQTFL
jgi:hypothetical protein